MNLNHRIIHGMFAMAAFLSMMFPLGQAHAQRAAAEPRIDGFDVKAAARAAPGAELAFTLYGSPGGAAAVQIGGAVAGMALVETDVGIYEGSYTIGMRDKITAQSTATANLRLGNKVASTVLDEPLIGKPGARRAGKGGSAGALKIDRFDIDPPGRLAAGEELALSMTGSPNAAASARIVGVRGKLVLDEVRNGVYEGTYTIKNRDRIAANAVVTGNLRIGDRETTAVLGKSLVAAAGNPPSPRRAAQRAAQICVNCGVVEAVNVIEVKGDGTYLGKIAGGLAGVLLGSQIGSGRGTTAAQVAGAVGGAIAGNEIERRVKTSKHYEVLVRLQNGGTQTFSYPEQPSFAVGAKVKVENGTLVAG